MCIGDVSNGKNNNDNLNNDNSTNTSDANIWVASSDGDLNRVIELLNQGISIDSKDENGYTPLQAAASYSHLDLVKFLVEHGANVNLCDSEGDSPLHVCGSADCAQYLISKNADYKALNSLQQTPIDVALEDEREDVLQYLTQYTLQSS